MTSHLGRTGTVTGFTGGSLCPGTIPVSSGASEKMVLLINRRRCCCRTFFSFPADIKSVSGSLIWNGHFQSSELLFHQNTSEPEHMQHFQDDVGNQSSDKVSSKLLLDAGDTGDN